VSGRVEIRVPDIGGFEEVPVIEVLIAPGDTIEAEQSLITLESDKATMEVPSPLAGKVVAVEVAVGDTVSEGALIAVVEAAAAVPVESSARDVDADAERHEPQPVPAAPPQGEEPQAEYEFDLVVLGAGPGGYSAAFRAADLGLKVALVERYPVLGGVCLNVGCIPSKALLHAANVIEEAAMMAEHGVEFGAPRIDLDRLRGWKDGVVGQLTGGLAGMAKRRGVTVIQGEGAFTAAHEIEVSGAEGKRQVGFARAIIAAGSQSLKLPGLPWDDPRLMDSTGALALQDVPERLLVIGGGIIGLEMASVYQALGSRVTVVELTPQLMPGTDRDLVRPLQKRIESRYEAICLETRVSAVRAEVDGLHVEFEGKQAPSTTVFDRILVSVGRVPNGHHIGAEAAGVDVNERGYVPVDRQMRSNVPHIFAIGDIVGPPMLAHKATHEGKVAAEVCAGRKSAFEARVIPSVAYTDPEVAWVGLTEDEAGREGIAIEVGKFPWAASGRALGIGRPEGFTKLLFDPQTNRIVGAGIVGPHAGDLIAECALAIEMGCEAADIGLTIHPHPTLSETVAFSAEVFEGTVTDLYVPKRGKR